MIREALISGCGHYRYWLRRTWAVDIDSLYWIMLNPSTADAERDDPTIRRVIDFSKRFGFGGCVVLNLYALRSTSPMALWKVADPIGPDNDRHLLDETAGKFVVAAWGVNAKPDRERIVLKLIRDSALDITCLSLTRTGKPGHPLFLPKASKQRQFPMVWKE